MVAGGAEAAISMFPMAAFCQARAFSGRSKAISGLIFISGVPSLGLPNSINSVGGISSPIDLAPAA